MRRNIQRQNKGNMLIIVSVTMTLIGLGLTVGLSFGGLYLAQTLLQSFANQMALSGACILNGANKQDLAKGVNCCDRIGQMNNIIVRSRSAVCESKKNLDTAQQQSNDQQLQALADQLYQQAREGAQTLEPERKKLKQVAEQEVTDEINKEIKQITQFNLILPWLQLNSPQLANGSVGIQFGQVKGVTSNVMGLDDNNEVNGYDGSSGTTSTPNKRYKQNWNCKLQGIDSDLDFRTSSLAPPVKGDVSQARIILGEQYEDLPNGQIDLPSTVQVTLVMNIQTNLGAVTKNQLKVVGRATTTGGAEMR